jgi:intermediate cleaving peptidase 55
LALYNLVLAVQRTCVSLCRASANTSLDKLHALTERLLADGLRDLGFNMNSSSSSLFGGSNGSAITTLFPHHVGHYVGLDVHDSVGFSRRETLKEGMCVTIEPGVYITDDARWPEEFRGIGIRIEDSVAVGEDSPMVLTTEAVKEVVDIEALRL